MIIASEIAYLEQRIRAAELRREACDKCEATGYRRRNYIGTVREKCVCQEEVDKRKLELADYLDGEGGK